MKGKGSRCSIRNVVTFAGAFIAWIIGSGFATGQEILQFFTSYGYYSYGVVLLNLLGFLFLGQVLLTTGYAHREEVNFNHFTFFCGKNVGRFYSWLIPVTLLMIMAVLISGAGATISEYYGINRYLGSMIMAVMVLCAYLTGFEKMVRIVSTIGPVIIAFTLMVGLATVIRGAANLSHIRQYETVLGASRSAPNWLIICPLHIPELSQRQHLFYGSGDDGPQQEGSQMGGCMGRLNYDTGHCHHEYRHPASLKGCRVPGGSHSVSGQTYFQCAGRCFFRCPCPGYVFLLLHHDVDGLQPFLILCARQKQDGRSCGGCICVPAGNAAIQPLNQCILSLCGIYGTDLYRMRGL